MVPGQLKSLHRNGLEGTGQSPPAMASHLLFHMADPNAELQRTMLRITDLDGPTLRFEGVLSGPEVDLAAEHCDAMFALHDRIEIDLAFLSYADRAGIRWLRSLPRDRVTVTHAPLMIEELLREEGAA